MVVIKVPHMKYIPECCNECIYNATRSDSYKEWPDHCELCTHSIDDDQDEDWVYGGNNKPKNCPLVEAKEVKGEDLQKSFRGKRSSIIYV